jgi:hypothetical protein
MSKDIQPTDDRDREYSGDVNWTSPGSDGDIEEVNKRAEGSVSGRATTFVAPKEQTPLKGS